jgi:hypothetical protein
MEQTANNPLLEGIHKRRIRMEDGRYLVFFTFDADGNKTLYTQASAWQAHDAQPTDVKPEATEERRV